MTRPHISRALTGAGGCAAIFLILALAANGATAPRFDRLIEDQVHQWVLAHPPWPQIGRVTGTITEPANLRIAAVLIAAGLFVAGRWLAGAWLLATMAVSGTLGVILKVLFTRPRPAWPDPIALAGGYSFPSGHALNSAAAAGCVIVLLSAMRRTTDWERQWRIAGCTVALLLTVVAGLDRVLIGVHYPSDVVAGWAAGACVVLLMWSALALRAGRPVFPLPMDHAADLSIEEGP